MRSARRTCSSSAWTPPAYGVSAKPATFRARSTDGNPELRQALDQIGAGRFSPDEPGRFQPIVQALLDHGDHYLLLADYAA